MRPEAADVSRELERQHGHGAVWKVDAGAAQARFLVERGFGRNVLGNVGDVDLQLEISVCESADRDGVVEVTRGFSVDGDDG